MSTPLAASSRATARPMPEDAPVTMATLPQRLSEPRSGSRRASGRITSSSSFSTASPTPPSSPRPTTEGGGAGSPGKRAFGGSGFEEAVMSGTWDGQSPEATPSIAGSATTSGCVGLALPELGAGRPPLPPLTLWSPHATRTGAVTGPAAGKGLAVHPRSGLPDGSTTADRRRDRLTARGRPTESPPRPTPYSRTERWPTGGLHPAPPLRGWTPPPSLEA